MQKVFLLNQVIKPFKSELMKHLERNDHQIEILYIKKN